MKHELHFWLLWTCAHAKSWGRTSAERNSIRRFLPLFALILYLVKVKDAGVSHILISRSCRTVKLNVAIFTIQLELSRTLLVSLWT